MPDSVKSESKEACLDLDPIVYESEEAILVELGYLRELARTPVSLRDDSYEKGYHDALALSIDLRGFSSFARDASKEKVTGFLEKYSQELLAAVNGYSASYYKLLGDGALVIWDEASEESTAACRDLFRLLREVVTEVAAGYGSPCALAGGLTVDDLYKYEIFGECSGLKYRDYIGYGINIAFRLQSMARPGELLASPGVAQRFCPEVRALEAGRKPPLKDIKGLRAEDYAGIVVLED